MNHDLPGLGTGRTSSQGRQVEEFSGSEVLPLYFGVNKTDSGSFIIYARKQMERQMSKTAIVKN